LKLHDFSKFTGGIVENQYVRRCRRVQLEIFPHDSFSTGIHWMCLDPLILFSYMF
jgi:hypothetical protein